MLTVEAFAHEIRGGITIFCIIWSFLLFPARKQSRMMQLLFISTLWLSLSYLKDTVFIFEAVKNNIFVDNLAKLLDQTFFPFICAFFIEATRPGLPKNWHIALALALQLCLIAAYVIKPDAIILLSAYFLSLTMAIATLFLVIISSSRYDKVLLDNYSNIENKNVSWVRYCLLFFVFVISYPLLFNHNVWLAEAVYNLSCMIVLSFLFFMSKKHKVVNLNIDVYDAHDNSASSDCNDELISNKEDIPMKDDLIGKKLFKTMEEDKLFLNPELSLREVSAAIGSNMKYLSLYLNRNLGTSFYEYVNKFRVEEACVLIQRMERDGRINMAEVAQLSGFNSLSSFNRYFKKEKNMTPKEYYYFHKN